MRVLFDSNKRAVGVEYQPNPRYHNNGSIQTVKASKMVVLSTGANATPLILERSGVGDPEVLKRAGVPVVEELPGVGNDYQDHHLSLWAYRSSLSPRETINAFSDGRYDVEQKIKEKDELLGWNSMDASMKCRPTEADVEGLGRDFKKAWEKDFKYSYNRPLMIIAMYLG